MISELNSITNSSSDEHEELLAEMELIERLPTQERLKQAKRRRALQLKKWSDYEREYQMGQQQHNTLNSQADELNGIEQFVEQQMNGRSSKRKKNGKTMFKNRSIKFQDHIVLLDAIMRKDYDEVERLLIAGITPNSANEDGLTAIHQCCIDDSADLLRLLISYGADVNVCDNDMWTPLHAAATCANLHICKILIENKAELLAVNTDGNMPYDICDDEVCLEYIESEMAKKGVTQQAIDMKRSETEMKMLDDLKQICLPRNSFDSSYMSSNDKSSLQNFYAYFNSNTNSNVNNSEVYLDLNTKDNNGATLLHIASANGYTSILEFLLIDCTLAIESGVKIVPPSLAVTDNDGWTPLHVATFWGHQKVIEILLEHGADINLRTNNDETVLELCDDPDIRDYIIQKSKEIESQQQQAAALAAMQKQMQLIYNANSISNSTNSMNESLKKSNPDNSSIINNSTRSLKRTSTGVSRSSSVRRSSFRDKEKAARKFDTSFKDVLYANETEENLANLMAPKKDESKTRQSVEMDEKLNNLKNKNVVKIVNNTQSNSFSAINNQKSSNTHHHHNQLNEPSTFTSSNTNNTNTNNITTNTNTNMNNKKSFVDDHNNNQLLKIGSNQSNQSAAAAVVARIQSNGMGSVNSNSIQKNLITSNTNASVTSSLSNGSNSFISNSSVYPASNNNNNNNIKSYNHVAQITKSADSTLENSSVAVINVNNLEVSSIRPGGIAKKPAISEPNDPRTTVQLQNNRPASSIEAIGRTTTVQPTISTNSRFINQQTRPTNDKENLVNATDVDGVKYKFISNETIGAKNSPNNEFGDVNSESASGKFSKCSKCLKRCFVM